MVNAIIAHPILQIAEIASHKGEVALVERLAVKLPHHVKILIKAIEVAFGPEAAQDLTAMPAAAKGHVDIYTAGPDIQPVDALFQ